MSVLCPTSSDEERKCGKSCRPILGRRSFTLIELLVVVAIIALLISILLPSLSAARDSSKRAVCMANLHAIGLALNSYANNYQSFIPGFKQIGHLPFRRGYLKQETGYPYREVFGVNAILHTDQTPRLLPNGNWYADDPGEPVYVPGDSKVWMCPSNPGPYILPDFRQYGNTYAYACNGGKFDPNNPQAYNQETGFNVGSSIYNLDRLATDPVFRRSNAITKIPLLWDSFNNRAGHPAMIPNESQRQRDFSVGDPNQQRQPHRASGFMNRGAAKVWIAYYPDGHCQMNGWN